MGWGGRHMARQFLCPWKEGQGRPAVLLELRFGRLLACSCRSVMPHQRWCSGLKGGEAESRACIYFLKPSGVTKELRFGIGSLLLLPS